MTTGPRLSLDSMRYDLPRRLIAQEPLPDRTDSRLLVVDAAGRTFKDSIFSRLRDHLQPGDLLVLNDTRVFRARLRGVRRNTGGKVELFLLKDLGNNRWKAMVKPGRAARKGNFFQFSRDLVCEVEEEISRGRYTVRFESEGDISEILQQSAQVPLPPYIRRDPEELDDHRYQTVFASRTGAVAAPTAGLHFTLDLLKDLRSKGIGHTFVTLHVGPGTFQPLRHDILEENRLDPEEYHISALSLRTIREARTAGGRIVAVGTTTTRILESIDLNTDSDLSGETDIFIFPPYRFRNVDALITNFHLPGSSLLCLVSAFMGHDLMMDCYGHAVEEEYRFYSYGDAMLIQGDPQK